MLTREGCLARRARLWAALPEPRDVLIVADPAHLIYFANYAPSPFEFRANESAAVLILTPDQAILVVDNLLLPYADRAFVDDVRAPVWYNGKRSAPHRKARLVATATDALRCFSGARFGIESASVPAGLVPTGSASRPGEAILDLDPVIRPLRRGQISR